MRKLIALTMAVSLSLNAMDDESPAHCAPRVAVVAIGMTFVAILWGSTQPLEECGCMRINSMEEVKLKPLGQCRVGCSEWCEKTGDIEPVCAPSSYFSYFRNKTKDRE